MNKIKNIAQRQPVKAALDDLAGQGMDLEELIISIQQIPSPTFAEAVRAEFVTQHLSQVGLSDVQRDELGNVYGRFCGSDGTRPPVIITAHTDTVFPPDTDLAITRDEDRIHGPGIGDNSTGVAALITLAQLLTAYQLQPAADIWLVANVGEEGMGDLRGMRAVFSRFGHNASYIVLEGGLYGQICHQAIGVRRWRIDIAGSGGHSWGSFGTTSAIHVLGHLIAAIDQIEVPKEPRTSYNVGVIEGGITINTIAPKASLWLDLRSEEKEALHHLEDRVQQLVGEIRANFAEVSLNMTLVGDRPAGQIPRDTLLVRYAEAALAYVSDAPITYIIGSTDTNIPLSAQVPAVCVGVSRSGNAHRVDEYLETAFLIEGMSQILLLSLAAADYT